MSTPLFDSTIVGSAEQALDFIGNILESSTEYSVIGKDLEGNILLWNEGARRLYGYEPEEVVGRANSSLLHTPKDVREGKPQAILNSALSDGKWAGTIKRLRKNGQEFVARVVITPRRDASGRAIGFLLISKDISDEIRLSEPLKATRFYTRSLIESNIDALMTTDPLGLITDVTQQMEALTGRTRDELIGSPFKTYFTDPQRAEEGIRLVLREGKVTNYELTARAKDGKETVVSYNATTLSDRDGKPQGVFAAARDVTERKRFEQALQEKNVELESASRAKDRLLRMVSHELRTPLTPVLLAITALLDRPAAPGPEVRSTLEMIRDNVELETRLIDDLLSFSSIARGKLRFDLVCTDVHEVIRRAKETCRAEAQAVGLDLVLKLGAAEHHARGDSTRLQQVFWNLIRNAIKFTPAGGGVTIRTRNEGDAPGKHLIVEVCDTGIGIEPQALSRIFQPFEQGEPTPNQRRHGGLGLGLAISRGFAEAHGGRLSAASAGAGRGATFTLQLATASPPGPAVSVPRSSRDEVPRAPGMRILLVEDNRPTLECLAVFLGRCRHVVRAATDLSSAMRLAAAEEFDLVISDIELPDGSGLDLMRWIRAARPIAGIAVSGFGADEDLRMSREAGFAEHLTKPILARDLEAAIARTHQATRATRSSNGSSGDTMPDS